MNQPKKPLGEEILDALVSRGEYEEKLKRINDDLAGMREVFEGIDTVPVDRRLARGEQILVDIGRSGRTNVRNAVNEARLRRGDEGTIMIVGPARFDPLTNRATASPETFTVKEVETMLRNFANEEHTIAVLPESRKKIVVPRPGIVEVATFGDGSALVTMTNGVPTESPAARQRRERNEAAKRERENKAVNDGWPEWPPFKRPEMELAVDEERCPYCGGVAHAEWEDNGVGLQQVAQFRCDDCDAMQIGHRDEDDLTLVERVTGYYRPEGFELPPQFEHLLKTFYDIGHHHGDANRRAREKLELMKQAAESGDWAEGSDDE